MARNLIVRARRAAGFVRFVVGRFIEDRCTQIAASLTYTTLLSLVPLITIAITLFTAFPAFSTFSTHIKVFLLTNMVPDAAGKVITIYMQQFADNAGKLTAVGIIFLGVTAMLLIQTIENAFNDIWRVDRKRPMAQRVVTYWAVLTLGPLLIGASLSLTSWVVSASMGLTRQIPEFGIVVLRVVPVILTTMAFTLMFHTVPNGPVQRRHALVGGLVAALLLEGMNRGFGLYIKAFPTYKLVYGAFAAVPIFLLWIYLSWMAVLIGAQIAASLPLWQLTGGRRARLAGHRFHQGMALLRALTVAQHRGQVPTLRELRRDAPEDLGAVLEVLQRVGWVRRVVGDGWVLVRDPGEIAVADVFRLFVFDASLTESPEVRVRDMLERLSGRVNVELGTSLRELYLAPHAGAAVEQPAGPVAMRREAAG